MNCRNAKRYYCIMPGLGALRFCVNIAAMSKGPAGKMKLLLFAGVNSNGPNII
jgi:hypothetical protein